MYVGRKRGRSVYRYFGRYRGCQANQFPKTENREVCRYTGNNSLNLPTYLPTYIYAGIPLYLPTYLPILSTTYLLHTYKPTFDSRSCIQSARTCFHTHI